MKENNNRYCSECMYHQNINDCIRKKEKVLDSDVCFHCVTISERHSLEKLIEMMAEMFNSNEA